MNSQISYSRVLIQFIPIDTIISAILYYLLGVSISRYLGNNIDWSAFIIGLFIILFLLLLNICLFLYFKMIDFENRNNLFKRIEFELKPKQVVITQKLFLYSSIFMMILASFFILFLYTKIQVNILVLLFLMMFIILIIIDSVPPMSFGNSSYGIMINTFCITFLIPMTAFILQGNELHRLVLYICLPLFFIFFSMKTIVSIKNFGLDSKYDIKSFSTTLGWEKSINIHNFLMILGYLLLGSNIFLDIPSRIILPGMITLPIGIFQIIYLNQIVGGQKPNWQILNILSIATALITPYLITYALWIG